MLFRGFKWSKKNVKHPSINELVAVFTEYRAGLITCKQALTQLKMPESTFFRKLNKFSLQGAEGLEHGNRGRSPVNKLDKDLRERIDNLLQTKYAGFQAALARKYLKNCEQIEVSEEFIRQRLLELYPREKKAESKGHPLRRRRSRFGELIQIDGSRHRWFGEDEPFCVVHAFIDDATGTITAACLRPTEVGEAYRELIMGHVLKYGIPAAFYSDRHSIFKPTTSGPLTSEDQDGTQYQRICNMLGIEYIYAKTPEAKGRIERLNQTLQGRWPKEFKLRGIKDINTANLHIEEFVNEYNEEFAIKPFYQEDAHVPLLATEEELKRICATWHERHLSKNLSCSFKNQIIQALGVENRHGLIGKEVSIVEYPDGKIEMLWGLRVIPIKIIPKVGCPKFEEYTETAKTIDARVDEIMAKENQRRQLWLNKRAAKVREVLNMRELVIEAAEEIIKEDSEKDKH